MKDLTRLAAAVVFVAATNILAPPRLSGQTIQGRVVEFEGGEPVPGASVRLLGEGGTVASAVTGDAGHFALTAPGPGEWRLTADFLGYRPVGPVPVIVAEAEVLTIELRLAVEPVAMEELVVVVRRANVNLAIRQFHRRRREGERTGFGHFLYGEELRSRGSARPSDVLRSVPGVMAAPGSVATGQIVRMRAGCIPDVYLDGMHLNRVNWAESLDPYVSTSDIEGIEVYRAAERPEGFYDPEGCGVVLVWTRNRSSESEGQPHTLMRWAVGVGFFLGFLMLQR